MKIVVICPRLNREIECWSLIVTAIDAEVAGVLDDTPSELTMFAIVESGHHLEIKRSGLWTKCSYEWVSLITKLGIARLLLTRTNGTRLAECAARQV